jgi:hypothetical protein
MKENIQLNFSNYYVAFLDILGFKEIFNSFGSNDFERSIEMGKSMYAIIHGYADSITSRKSNSFLTYFGGEGEPQEEIPRDKLSPYLEKIINYGMYHFSDSILLFIEEGNDFTDNVLKLKALSSIVNTLISKSILESNPNKPAVIPLRGGIAFGMALLDNETGINMLDLLTYASYCIAENAIMDAKNCDSDQLLLNQAELHFENGIAFWNSALNGMLTDFQNAVYEFEEATVKAENSHLGTIPCLEDNYWNSMIIPENGENITLEQKNAMVNAAQAIIDLLSCNETRQALSGPGQSYFNEGDENPLSDDLDNSESKESKGDKKSNKLNPVLIMLILIAIAITILTASIVLIVRKKKPKTALKLKKRRN